MSEFTVLGLRVVRESARCGSFSRAAERLGYTQSAISRQITLMEQTAGQPLFERHARGVEPTEAGQLVVQHAEVVLGELRATRHHLHELGAGRPGRLRIGAFSTAMSALLPRVIAAFAHEEPRTRLPLREGTSISLLNAVARGRIDIAVVTLPQHLPDEVVAIPFLDDPLLVAIASGHPFATRTSVTPALLRNEQWIAGNVESGSTLLGAWTDSSWKPDIRFVVRDWVAKLGLVSAGLGITIVPGVAVPALPPGIAVVRIDHVAAVRTTAVVQRADDLAVRRQQKFVELLRDTAAELSAGVRRTVRRGATAE